MVRSRPHALAGRHTPSRARGIADATGDRDHRVRAPTRPRHRDRRGTAPRLRRVTSVARVSCGEVADSPWRPREACDLGSSPMPVDFTLHADEPPLRIESGRARQDAFRRMRPVPQATHVLRVAENMGFSGSGARRRDSRPTATVSAVDRKRHWKPRDCALKPPRLVRSPCMGILS